jgi:S-adenosylmethionine decarboxylase
MLHFGEHLMVDGYGGSFTALSSKDKIFQFLSELPGILNMEAFGGPEVYLCENDTMKDSGGYSGVVAIKESHISIHSFPQRGFATMDIYTCNTLDRDTVLNYTKNLFSFTDLEVYFQLRGTRFPDKDIYTKEGKKLEVVLT